MIAINKLERVLWRLRKKYKGDNPIIPNHELRKAIMRECGTSNQCYKDNRASFFQLGWIKAHGSKKIQLTDDDLIED